MRSDADFVRNCSKKPSESTQILPQWPQRLVCVLTPRMQSAAGLSPSVFNSKSLGSRTFPNPFQR